MPRMNKFREQKRAPPSKLIGISACCNRKDSRAGDAHETMDDVNNSHGSIAYDHSGADWRNTSARFHYEKVLWQNSRRPARRSLRVTQQKRLGTSQHQLAR